MSESDGIEEVVHGSMATLLTAAATAASIAAQARADSLRRAAERQDQDVAALQSRLEAERQLAIAELRSLDHQEHLTREQATRAWRLAETWREQPEVEEIRDALAERIEAEHGVDPRRDRVTAADVLSTTAVAASVVQAEAEDQAVGWDSDQRRQAAVAQMSEAGVEERLVAAAAVADLANATPPTEAVRGRAGKSAPRRRPDPQKGLDLQR